MEIALSLLNTVDLIHSGFQSLVAAIYIWLAKSERFTGRIYKVASSCFSKIHKLTGHFVAHYRDISV